MIQELAHRIDPLLARLLARQTARHDDAFTALGDELRFIDEEAEIVFTS
jgi:hypothetical protein